MKSPYSLVGPSLFMDERGKLFAKQAKTYVPVRTKEAEAEERYVDRHTKKGVKDE